MINHPRGVWIWVLDKITPDYLSKLANCKVGRVYLKVFDSVSNPMFWDDQCTKSIIKQFKSKGIEVYGWGYHRGESNIGDQVNAVTQAMQCGLAGYILDLEAEVEDPSTHPKIKDLLKGLRPVVGDGNLGYTSFGSPELHPSIPWKILDDNCDIALPQIYFEKFSFGKTNEDEVKACLDAHEAIGLKKPIFPIFGSEEDAKVSASAKELQSFLDRFPSSSIFRVPNVGQKGEALNLNYSKQSSVPIGSDDSAVAATFSLPSLSRILKVGSKGEDVKALQRVLNAQAFLVVKLDEDGDFGSATKSAVISFQKKAGITVDGEVGSQTWKALGGKDIPLPPETPLVKLADFAEDEASKGLSWKSSDDEAEKYLDIFRKPMLDLGQIGTAKVFYDWCAAFVYYCCREVDISIPIQPDGFWATMALTDSWIYWAEQEDYWHPVESITPKRGDIVLFDYEGDGSPNHIGIVRGYTPDDDVIQTSEGNRGNVSGNFVRSMSIVLGFIRIL